MQAEDHEAGIEAALEAWPTFSFISNGKDAGKSPAQRARREALLRAILPAYLSRCPSPQAGNHEAGNYGYGDLPRLSRLDPDWGRYIDHLEALLSRRPSPERVRFCNHCGSPVGTVRAVVKLRDCPECHESIVPVEDRTHLSRCPSPERDTTGQIVAWLRREYSDENADATWAHYGQAIATVIEQEFSPSPERNTEKLLLEATQAEAACGRELAVAHRKAERLVEAVRETLCDDEPCSRCRHLREALAEFDTSKGEGHEVDPTTYCEVCGREDPPYLSRCPSPERDPYGPAHEGAAPGDSLSGHLTASSSREAPPSPERDTELAPSQRESAAAAQSTERAAAQLQEAHRQWQEQWERAEAAERDTVRRIVEWLRGPAAEEARAWAIDHDVPPEDELAGQVERAFLAEFSADDTNEGR